MTLYRWAFTRILKIRIVVRKVILRVYITDIIIGLCFCAHVIYVMSRIYKYIFNQSYLMRQSFFFLLKMRHELNNEK